MRTKRGSFQIIILILVVVAGLFAAVIFYNKMNSEKSVTPSNSTSQIESDEPDDIERDLESINFDDIEQDVLGVSTEISNY